MHKEDTLVTSSPLDINLYVEILNLFPFPEKNVFNFLNHFRKQTSFVFQSYRFSTRIPVEFMIWLLGDLSSFVTACSTSQWASIKIMYIQIPAMAPKCGPTMGTHHQL